MQKLAVGYLDSYVGHHHFIELYFGKKNFLLSGISENHQPEISMQADGGSISA